MMKMVSFYWNEVTVGIWVWSDLLTFYVDEYMTMKQVAAVRFHRNHRLMMEVFSDVCVPDPRTG